MTNPPWGEQPEQPDRSGQGQHQPPGQGQPPGQPYPPYGGQQPYGQQPYGGYGYPYAAPAPTNGLAIASMVTSVAGLVACCGAPSIVGAILGHMARKRIRESGEQGDGLALAGIIVGWIAFGIFLLVAAIYGVAIFASIASDPGSG